MKVLKFTTTIPEQFRKMAYTEAVSTVSPDWSFVDTFGFLIAHNKIHGLIRNINENYFVESYYFVDDNDFLEVRDHIVSHMSIFDNTEMPFTVVDNLNFNNQEMIDLINRGNHEVQILSPDRFESLINTK